MGEFESFDQPLLLYLGKGPLMAQFHRLAQLKQSLLEILETLLPTDA